MIGPDPIDRTHCWFCTEPPEFTHAPLRHDAKPGVLPPVAFWPLCAAHVEAITAAMYRGRVHKPTGIRWWWYEYAPQSR